MASPLTEEIPLTERYDGWQQEVGGLGSTRDKHVGISFDRSGRMNRRSLDAMYESNAIAARYVDLIVDESFREGWKFKDASFDGKGADLYKRLRDEMALDASVAQAAKWSRLYGYALNMVPTNAEPRYPLGLSTPTCMYATFPIAGGACNEVRPLNQDKTLGSATYRKILNHEITPILGGDTVIVHRSHSYAFEPIPMPYGSVTNAEGLGVGPSVLDRLFEPLSRYGASHAHANALLYVASIMFLKLDGWSKDYKKVGGPELLQKKIADMRQQLDSLGLLGLDKNDELGTASHSVTGAFQLVEKMSDYLSAHVDMPREILFNESPTGLRGGELSGPQALWYGKVKTYQVKTIEPALRHAIDIAALVWDYGGDYEIEWAELWKETEKEKAERYKLLSEADRAYFEMGVISSEEIREARFVKGSLSVIEVTAEDIDPLDTTANEVELPDPEPSQEAPPAQPEKPADEALSGGQITSLLAIAEKATTGAITRESAIEIVKVSFPSHAGRAEALVGLPAQPVAPAPAAAQPEPEADVQGGEFEAPPSTDPIPSDLVTPKRAGELMGGEDSPIHSRTITNLMNTGKLRYFGLGSQRRVSAAEVKALAQAHETPEDIVIGSSS